MPGGKHMAKQLDCTTSIASTQNNGVDGIHCSPNTTFSRLRGLASKRKQGQINISGVDWTTSKLNHSNWQMACKSFSLNIILGSVMIVGLKLTHISSEHYTTRICGNVLHSFLHISLFQAQLKCEPVYINDSAGR
jgi:hypothetical protein